MLLSIRLWLGQKLFGIVGDPDFPVGVRVAPKRMIKWHCQQPEVEGLRYAALNTTIPIPTLYKVHQYYGQLALEMEYFQDCETLHKCWRSLSEQQKHSIVNEVSGYITQLRKLRQREHRISSANGGLCRDVRVGDARFGPFTDSAAFHKCLRAGVEGDPGRAMFGEKIMQIHSQKYETCFTHGDLGVQNILVRKGKVAAILDWECSGWYPEYWEYTKAHYNSVYLPEFYEMLRQVVDRYDEELEAERHLWRTLDQPLNEFPEH